MSTNHIAQPSPSCSGSTVKQQLNNPGLHRLLEMQQDELNSIDKKIDMFTKHKNDYQDLSKLIKQMSERVEHKHKVPIAGSQLALVPGKLIHTNEILVLLGDNYFALRSTKQADEIIRRRLEKIKSSIKEHNEAKKKTADWFQVVSEHKREKEEFVEIIETS